MAHIRTMRPAGLKWPVPAPNDFDTVTLNEDGIIVLGHTNFLSEGYGIDPAIYPDEWARLLQWAEFEYDD